MTEQHLITREIGIDAGHRVTFHGSKCRNLHGHRYTIQATCQGPLFTEGEQTGMVLDFGFLKEEMVNQIDVPCDHGQIIWAGDHEVLGMFAYVNDSIDYAWVDDIAAIAEREGFAQTASPLGLKVYVVPFMPTAENLARHWFERLTPRVVGRSDGKATLLKVKVWETPNCSAEYPG